MTKNATAQWLDRRGAEDEASVDRAGRRSRHSGETDRAGQIFLRGQIKDDENIKQEKVTGEDSICSRERKTKPHIQKSLEFLTVLQEKEKKEGCKFS